MDRDQLMDWLFEIEDETYREVAFIVASYIPVDQQADYLLDYCESKGITIEELFDLKNQKR